MTQRIVVGVDSSDNALAALRWAAQEARLRDAELAVVHAWTVPVAVDPVGLAIGGFSHNRADLGALAQQACNNILDKLGPQPNDPKILTRVIEGMPARVLLDEAKDASLVVVGARGHGGFLGLLLGSVSSVVTHHAPCPVVVVPSNG